MDYEVYITRKVHWRDMSRRSITMSEWLAYVQSDSEMQQCYAYIDGADGETRLIMIDVAKWKAHPQYEECEDVGWFGHLRDRIRSRNPDLATLRKMHQIAMALDAKVQGAEGEEYDANGEIVQATRDIV